LQSRTLPLKTAHETLTGGRPSDGHVITPYGFAFHQSAKEKLTPAGGTPGESTVGIPEMHFQLRVDLNNGHRPKLYKLTIPAIQASKNSPVNLKEHFRTHVSTFFAEKVDNSTVSFDGDKYKFTSTGHIDLTVIGQDTIVSGDDSFQHIKKIKTGDGQQAILFGNEYWHKRSFVEGAATALTGAIARTLMPTLTIDTSATVEDKNPVILDFRNVNRELRFSFSQGSQPGRTTLTVTTRRNLEIPIVGLGTTAVTNKLVITDLDANSVLYTGRYENTINFDRGAVYQGRLIGSSGNSLTGLLTFPGAYTDKTLNFLSLVEEIGLDPSGTIDSLTDAYFQVSNSLSYESVLDVTQAKKLISQLGLRKSIESIFSREFLLNFGNYINLEQLNRPFSEKNTGQNALDVIKAIASGNPAYFLDQIVHRGLNKLSSEPIVVSGLSGLTDNFKDASLGDVVVRSGINFVRGTDYNLGDQESTNPFAFRQSGADTISIGDNPLSLQPGLHLLAGGSGGDTYVFNTQLWGLALVMDNLEVVSLDGLSDDESFQLATDLLMPSDTADFSNLYGDFIYDVIRYDPFNPPDLEDPETEEILALLGGFQKELASTQPGDGFLEASVVIVRPENPSELNLPNYAVLLGVENIVGSRGKNTFNFHGAGRLGGKVSPGFGGTLHLNYEKSELVQSTGDGDGIEVLLNEFADEEYISTFIIDGLPDLEDTPFEILIQLLPNVTYQFGSATGTGYGQFGVAVGGDVTGTKRDDVITGNLNGQSLSGEAGNDTISGKAGDDTLFGGDGDDVLDGGIGSDTFYPGNGSNTIRDELDELKVLTVSEGVIDSSVVKFTENTDGISPDMIVTGVGVPAGIAVHSVNANNNEVTLTGKININENEVLQFTTRNDIDIYHAFGDRTSATDLAIIVSNISSQIATSVNLSDYSHAPSLDSAEIDLLYAVETIDISGGNPDTTLFLDTKADNATQTIQFLNYLVADTTFSSNITLVVDPNDKLDLVSIPFGDAWIGDYDAGVNDTLSSQTIELQYASDKSLSLKIHGYKEITGKDFAAQEILRSSVGTPGNNAIGINQTTANAAFSATKDSWLDAITSYNTTTETNKIDATVARSRLDSTQVILEDLPDGQLAVFSFETGNGNQAPTITIDQTADDYGWYVADPTANTPMPLNSSLFDLSTVLLHEVGHALNVWHKDEGLMGQTLSPGQQISNLTPFIPEINLGEVPHSGSLLTEKTFSETIGSGLSALNDWTGNLSQSLTTQLEEFTEIPLIGDVIEGPVQDFITSVTADLTTTFDEHITTVTEAIRGNPFDAAAALHSLDIVGPAPSGRPGDFSADFELLTHSFDVQVNLDYLKDAFGLDLSSFVDLTQTEPLTIELSLDLRFVFGVDAVGEFFAENPELVAQVTVSHEDPLGVVLDVGPVGVGIVDGTIFFEAGLVFPAKGRFTEAEVSGLGLAAPYFDPTSSFELDLPFELRGALAGLHDGTVARLYGAFNRPGDTPQAVSQLTATQFFTDILPQSIEFEGDGLDALTNLSQLSLDDALEGIKDVLKSAIREDGVAYKKLPFINQSAVELLGNGSVDVVQSIINGIGVVQENLKDINHFEIDLNRELTKALQLELPLEEFEGQIFDLNQAYRDLVGISDSLFSGSSDEDIAIAIAEKQYGPVLTGLRADRDVAAAATSLAEYGLTSQSTDLDVAKTLVERSEEQKQALQVLTDAQGALAVNVGFVTAWDDLSRYGFTETDDETTIADALNSDSDKETAEAARQVILEATVTTETAPEVVSAGLTLQGYGLSRFPLCTVDELNERFDNGETITDLQGKLSVVQQNLQLLVHIRTLESFGLTATSDEADLYLAVADSSEVGILTADRDLLQSYLDDTIKGQLAETGIGIDVRSVSGFGTGTDPWVVEYQLDDPNAATALMVAEGNTDLTIGDRETVVRNGETLFQQTLALATTATMSYGSTFSESMELYGFSGTKTNFLDTATLEQYAKSIHSETRITAGTGLVSDPWQIDYTVSGDNLAESFSSSSPALRIGGQTTLSRTYKQTFSITNTAAEEVALTVDDTTITLTLATPDGSGGLTPVAADDIAASLKNSLTALSSVKTASVSHESENSQFTVLITSADYSDVRTELLAAQSPSIKVNNLDVVGTTYRQLASVIRTIDFNIVGSTATISAAIAKAPITNTEAAQLRLAGYDLDASTPGWSLSDSDLAQSLFTTEDDQTFEEAKVSRNRLAHYDSIKPVDLEYSSSVLDLKINLAKAFTGEVDLAFNLEDIGALGEAISNEVFGLDFETAGKAFVDADVAFDLDFTFDFSSIGDPQFVVRDSSAIDFKKLKIETLAPIQASAGLVVGGETIAELKIVDAMISADITGRLSLVEDETDHQYSATELVSDSSLWDVNLVGTIDADLPIFFPAESMPLGGTANDENGDGIPDNVLHLDGTFRGDNNYDLNFVMPTVNTSILGNLFGMLNEPATLLSGLETMFGDLGKQIAENVASLNLPMIGDALDNSDQFVDDLRNKLLGQANVGGKYYTTDTPATNNDGTIPDSEYLDTIGGFLQKAIDRGEKVFDGIITLLRTEIYESLGDLLKVPATTGGTPLTHDNGTPEDQADDVPRYFYTTSGEEYANSKRDSDGRLVALTEDEMAAFGVEVAYDPNTGSERFDDNGDIVYRKAFSVDDVQLTLSEDGLAFNMLLAGNVFDKLVPLDFSGAFPGFGLKSTTQINFKLNYALGLGLGFSGSAGIYLDTSGVTEEGEELILKMLATVEDDPDNPDDGKLEAKLGFLNAGLTTITDDDGKTRIEGKFSVDLRDAGGDGKWTIFNPFSTTQKTEKLIAVARLTAFADADFHAVLEAVDAGDITLPSFSANIHYSQQFADITLSTAGGNSFKFGNSAEVILTDVTVDLGDIFEFLGPIVDEIEPILGKDSTVREIIDILTEELDLGITTLSFFDIAKLVMKPSAHKAAENAMNKIKEFSDFVTKVQAARGEGSSTTLNFGTFRLTGDTLNSDSADVPDDAVPSTTPTANGTTTPKQDAVLADLGGSPLGSATKPRKKGSINIPLLKDPKSALGFLTGKTVDLFEYTLPPIDLSFRYDQSFPIPGLPGLNAIIGGRVAVLTDLSFGFDTSGVIDWVGTDFLNAEPDMSQIGKVFNGFYFGDYDTNGNERPEITFIAELAAGASLGIGGLIEAGVMGGISLTVDADWNDLPAEGIDGPGDGKMRLEEITTRLDQSPMCLFDLHGELALFLEAFLKISAGPITIFDVRQKFVEIVLYSFDHECPPIETFDIAKRDGDKLTLEYNKTVDNADVRQDAAMKYELQYIAAEEDGIISDDARKELYKYASKTVATNQYAGEGEERQLVKDHDNNDLTTLTDSTGFIAVKSRGYVEVFKASEIKKIVTAGSSADDAFLISTDIVDRVDLIQLVGGSGNDTFSLGGVTPQTEEEEAAEVVGSPGHSPTIIVEGNAGNDNFIGSAYADFFYGGAGSDYAEGFGGDDKLYAQHDYLETNFDPLQAVQGDSTDENFISGGSGNDTIYGGLESDQIWGDDRKNPNDGGADTIWGLGGDDTIDAGVGDDVAYGGAGADVLFGRSGDDELHGGDHSDTLDGGADDDKLFGESGTDIFIGGSGDDELHGGADDDLAYWESADGSDVFIGGAGNDEISFRAYTFNPENFGATDQEANPYVVDDGLADKVTLTPIATDDVGSTLNVGIDWVRGAEAMHFSLADVEKVMLDTGEGADEVLVEHSLNNTAVEALVIDTGMKRTLVNEVRYARNGNADDPGYDDAVGQDIVFDEIAFPGDQSLAETDPTFHLQIGSLGAVTGPITIESQKNLDGVPVNAAGESIAEMGGQKTIDAISTAANIHDALRELFPDNDDVRVIFTAGIGYKVLGLGDVADAIRIDTLSAPSTVRAIQEISIQGSAGDQYQLRFGAQDSAPFTIGPTGDLTALAMTDALREHFKNVTTDNTPIPQDDGTTDYTRANPSVAYDSDAELFLIEGLPSGVFPEALATTLHVGTLDLSNAVALDEFDLLKAPAPTDNAADEFQYRFQIAADSSGGIDPWQTAAEIESVLQKIPGYEYARATYDSNETIFRVSGLLGNEDTDTIAAQPVGESADESISVEPVDGRDYIIRGLPGETITFISSDNPNDSASLSIVSQQDAPTEVDGFLTAAAFQDVIHTITNATDAVVVYQEELGRYFVTGTTLQFHQTLTPAYIQEITLSHVAGQVIRGTMTTEVNQTPTDFAFTVAASDGNIDSAATTEAIQTELRKGNSSLDVIHVASQSDTTGTYRITGFTSPNDSIVISEPDPVRLISSATEQRFKLNGNALDAFRLRFGREGHRTTDPIEIAQNLDGTIDNSTTASRIEAALGVLPAAKTATVGYDTVEGTYIIKGLGSTVSALEVDLSGLDGSVNIEGSAASVTQLVTVDASEGEQFRIQFGENGQFSSVITTGSDIATTKAALENSLKPKLGQDLEVRVTETLDDTQRLSYTFALSNIPGPSANLQLHTTSAPDGLILHSQSGKEIFKVIGSGPDQSDDSVILNGTTSDDIFEFSTSLTTSIDGTAKPGLRLERLTGHQTDNGLPERYIAIDIQSLETKSGQDAGDTVRLNMLAGNDSVDARRVSRALISELTLDGGLHNDTLIGTNQKDIKDIIIGGPGSDRMTGGAGVDQFEEAASHENNAVSNTDLDTLIEKRDADFVLTDTSLAIDDSRLYTDGFGNEEEVFADIFEAVELYGLKGSNSFTAIGWSDSGLLDGAGGGDTYIVEMPASGSVNGNQFFDIADSGVDGQDTLEFRGTADSDTIQLQRISADNKDRYHDFGDVGDGLIIGHFEAILSGYEKKNIDDDEEKFLSVAKSDVTAGSTTQAVNYFSVESVTVFAGRGDDTIVSDDIAAAMNVFGDAGDDQFYIGSVLETGTTLVDGTEVTYVTKITSGASVNGAAFFGGSDDDYFEVNHNKAEISLFGDNGDDTFVVKALLTYDSEKQSLGNLFSAASNLSGTMGEGSSQSESSENASDTQQVDIDSLVYIENANINIDGGAGFDAVSVVGTVLSDTFYVYTEEVEGQNVQRVYGAGVKVQTLVNVERLQILAGGGDDTVYLYGTDLGPMGDLVLKLGNGSDTVYVGGEQLEFTRRFPSSTSIYYTTTEKYAVEFLDSTGEAWKPATHVDGLPFYTVDSGSTIVPFHVDKPSYTTTTRVDEQRTITAFLSPVLIEGGNGLRDRVVIGLTNPVAAPLRLADEELKKRTALFEKSKISISTSDQFCTNDFGKSKRVCSGGPAS
jgi:Ca2+-binding RTX toxin-like protein